jgi:hypothetical protein
LGAPPSVSSRCVCDRAAAHRIAQGTRPILARTSSQGADHASPRAYCSHVRNIPVRCWRMNMPARCCTRHERLCYRRREAEVLQTSLMGSATAAFHVRNLRTTADATAMAFGRDGLKALMLMPRRCMCAFRGWRIQTCYRPQLRLLSSIQTLKHAYLFGPSPCAAAQSSRHFLNATPLHETLKHGHPPKLDRAGGEPIAAG